MEAVHHRHLDVHQDQVIVTAGRHFCRFFTVDRNIHLATDAGQQFNRHFAIDRIIFGQQDLRRQEALQQGTFSRKPRYHMGRQIVGSAAVDANCQPKTTALAQRTFHPDLAPHQPCQMAGDGEAKPGAAKFPAGRIVELFKSGKQQWQLGRGNTRSGIFNGKAQLVARPVFGQHLAAQGDAAMRRKFDGIPGQIEQGLAQAGGVADHAGRQAGAVEMNAQTLFLGAVADQRIHFLQDRRRAEDAGLQIDFSSFYFGEIKDVVDDLQ